jgi:LmbE family N-acetylglucosaminyl deacetylase
MQQIISADDVKQLGTILGVWAHPDDETFTSAGIMAAAIQNGQRVVCVTATRGEAGVQDESRWPAAQLGGIRAQELADAFKTLGVTEHHWLNCHDGDCCNQDTATMTNQLCDLIQTVRPDTILTFGPDGLTGHTDHQAVSAWATAAAKQLGLDIAIYHAVELRENYEKYFEAADEKFNIYFNTDKPPLKNAEDCDIYFCMTPDLQAKKRAALMAMPSQTEGLMNYFGEELFMQAFKCECFVKA